MGQAGRRSIKIQEYLAGILADFYILTSSRNCIYSYLNINFFVLSLFLTLQFNVDVLSYHISYLLYSKVQAMQYF